MTVSRSYDAGSSPQEDGPYKHVSLLGREYLYIRERGRSHELGTEFDIVEKYNPNSDDFRIVQDKTLVRIDGFAGWGRDTKQSFYGAIEQAKELNRDYAIKVLDHNLDPATRQRSKEYFVVFTKFDLVQLDQELLNHDFSWPETVAWIGAVAKTLKELDKDFSWQVSLCSSAIYLNTINVGNKLKINTQPQAILRDVGLNYFRYEKHNWLKNLSQEQLRYLSPEERSLTNPDGQTPQSQVYSLALLVFDLCKCQHPASNENDVDLLKESIKEQFGENEGLVKILAKALMADPNARYATPEEFANDLKNLNNEINKNPNSILPSQKNSENERKKSRRQTQSRYFLVYYRHKLDNESSDEKFPPQTCYLMVGRDPNNDIILNDAQVALRQLCIWRVDEEWYTVTELGDGTEMRTYQPARLNNIPLSPQFAANLTTEDRITIGHWDLWLGNSDSLQPVSSEHKVGRIEIPKREFNVKTGIPEPVVVPFQVWNFSNVVEDFWVIVDGAPSNWRIEAPDIQCHSPNVAKLDASKKSTEKSEIQIFLPPTAQSISKTYTLVVRLISSDRQVQIAADTVKIRLQPEYNFRCILTPKIIRLGREMSLAIENQGNFTQTFLIHFSDEKDAIDFRPPDARLVVRQGTKEQIKFRPILNGWHVTGGERTHQFTIEVQPEGSNKTEISTGQGTSTAIFRPWLLATLAALLILLIFMSATILKPQFVERHIYQHAVPVVSPIAGVPTILKWQAKNYCFASIYQNEILKASLNWRLDAYTITFPSINDIYEIQLRNCLFVPTKNWQISMSTPAPTPLPAPNILTFRTVPTSTLLGQTGDLCFFWQVDPLPTSLKIEPTIGDVEPTTGNKCVPLISVINNATMYTFSLKATNSEGAIGTTSASIAAYSPECPVLEGPLRVREGPGINYSQLFLVPTDQMMRLLGRPFYNSELTNGVWAEVVQVGNDPRPGWVDFTYLKCEEEVKKLLNTLPLSQPPPPTATPEPTVTLAPTVTPVPATATPVSNIIINITPNVITQGQCAVLSWNIQNVVSIHLDGAPQIGQGELAKCPNTTTTYVFSIVQRNNVAVEQKKVLVVNPLPVAPTEPLPPGQ